MANTDKFEMIAGMYDTPERIQVARVSSDAIRQYAVDAKGRSFKGRPQARVRLGIRL